MTLAPKPPEDLCGDLTDLTGSHDANGLTMDVKADQAAEQKIEFTHSIGSAMNLAIKR